jgi:hypothetical protein
VTQQTPQSATEAVTPLVALDHEGIPRVVMRSTHEGKDVDVVLDLHNAGTLLAALQEQVVTARALHRSRGITLPPSHAEVQALLTLARVAVEAHEAFADAMDDAVAGGSLDTLNSRREEALDALADAFARFDGEDEEGEDEEGPVST